MDLTNQDSDSEIFNLKVQHLRESVSLLRRKLNLERKTSIAQQRSMRSGYMQSARCTSSTNVLQRCVSTIQSNHHNQCNSANFLPKCEPQPAPEPNTLNTTDIGLPSVGQARPMPSRPRPRLWNNASLDSKNCQRPMAKLKAPGPYETQALSEIKRAKPGYPRPSPSNMYCAVSRIRKQRVQFFREQLDNIDNSCMQELKRIELSKCRLTPLLKESSAWRSSVFVNPSEMCIPVSPQNVCESQCTDRPMLRPQAGGRPVTFNTFEPIVNDHQSNGSGNRPISNMTRWYKTDVYNKASRARVSSNFGNIPTQYYDRQVLTQSSRVNTISYSSSTEKYRFEASKGPMQKYNNCARPIPELYSPYVGEEFCDRTCVADANNTNLVSYPSNYQKYEFNGQDHYEKNTSPLRQSANIGLNEDNISERNFAVNNSSSRPRYGSAYGLHSTTNFNEDHTKSEYRCSAKTFPVSSSDSSSTGYQPSSMCRLNATKRFNQERYTQTDDQCSDCSVSDFAKNSHSTATGSHPSLPCRLNTPQRFNREEYTQTEDQCYDRKYFVNNLSCSPGYQPKASPSILNLTTINRECSQSALPTLLRHNSEARSSVKELAVKSLEPAFTPLRNDSKYIITQNFKQDEHNSLRSSSMKQSPPLFDIGCSVRRENEMPIIYKNGSSLPLPDIEDDWFNSKSWTVDEVLKLDEEVTKSLWDVYKNQVRDLSADILKPFLSESTSAYLKQFSEEQCDREVAQSSSHEH